MQEQRTREEIMAELLEDGVSQTQMETFHSRIYEMVAEGLSVIEAISDYCEEHEIDPQVIKKLINPVMMDDLTKEACTKNLLKPSLRVNEIQF